MTRPALNHRACPGCGLDRSVPEIADGCGTEAQSLDALRPFWFGIEKGRRFFPYARCGGCGLLYNRIFFDDAQLSDLYSNMPPNMDLVGDAAIAATQQGYFAAVRDTVALDGAYLEIGPDVGHIVAEAARHGRFDRFWLFEPNRAVHPLLHAAAGPHEAVILTDMTNLSAVPDGSVGLAVMVHVLDHLIAPVPMLTAIGEKLKPDGALVIVTHDERSALRRLLGRRWPAFCLQHPELYNPATIRGMLQRAGFDTVTVARSRNHFPLDFLARQAAQVIGVRLPAGMLPKRSVALRLGNMLTVARAGQAAAETVAVRRASVA